MSHLTERVQLPMKDVKQHFLGGLKRVKAPKISRHKLQNEFACKGWKSCSLQSRSGDNDFDIISSPTEYPPSSKQVESSSNGVMKKPMLVEISNIEPLFLQNRSISSKVLVDKKLEQTFNNFIPTVNKKHKNYHKRASSDSLNFQTVKESFQNKKQCTKFVKPTESRVTISDTSSCKINNWSLDDSLNPVNKQRILNSFVSKSYKEFDGDCPNSNIFRTNKINYNSVSSEKSSLLHAATSLAVESENVSSVKEDKINKFDMTANQSCLAKKYFSDKSPNFCDGLTKKCLNKANEFRYSFVNDSVSDKCNSQDLDISIEDQSSPKVSVSSAISKTSVSPPVAESATDCSSTTVKQNFLKRPSEVINLHNLHESFQIKKQCTESNMSQDSVGDIIFDDSPVKINKDLSLSILHKLKNFSEIFGAESAIVKDVNKNSSQDIFIQDKNNYESLKCTTVASNSTAKAFMDGILGALSKQEKDFSDRKSLIINNKEFMETLQSSYQEKSFSIHKGSNWVQSLNWDQNAQLSNKTSEYSDQIEKKTLKNVVHGGFAEQMIKLQRRERSDKVIWDHKMNELKKKVAASSVTFTLMSVLFTGNVIMTKCRSESGNENFGPSSEFVEDSHPDANPITHGKSSTNVLATSVTDKNAKLFIVLFKREIFSKLQIKIGTNFILYPPWESLIVPSLPFPVILCTYFIEPINKIKEEVEPETTAICSYPVMYKNLQKKECECDEVFSSLYFSDSYCLYGKSVCVSARVQRIWQNKFMIYKKPSLLPDDYSSFAVLLQTVDGIFLQLKLISSDMSDEFYEFLSDAESRCFRFCDVIITHRYTLRNCFKLKKFIESLENVATNNEAQSRPQMFLYEIMPCYVKIPSSIPEENFPPYFSYDVKPLYQLQKKNLTRSRVSCIGKILFQFKEDFFITDESLLGSKRNKYCNLKFSFKMVDKSLIGSIVFIKEAECVEDYLLVDKFSKYEVFSASRSTNSALSFESRIKKIGLISYEHILSPLNLLSKVKELVLVKGTISEVDDSSALSWLECCFCFKENLLEDSNSVIYCEDCSCIVPKPVLNVKMDVTVYCPDLPKAKVKVQLLSTTVKRILKISEDNYQPECNISDVLHKSTGDLCCYIRNIENISEVKNFQLQEVNSF